MNSLKEKRIHALMSQEELSRKSGISRQYISEIETQSVQNLKLSTMQALARALSCTVTDIFVL